METPCTSRRGRASRTTTNSSIFSATWARSVGSPTYGLWRSGVGGDEGDHGNLCWGGAGASGCVGERVVGHQTPSRRVRVAQGAPGGGRIAEAGSRPRIEGGNRTAFGTS